VCHSGETTGPLRSDAYAWYAENHATTDRLYGYSDRRSYRARATNSRSASLGCQRYYIGSGLWFCKNNRTELRIATADRRIALLRFAYAWRYLPQIHDLQKIGHHSPGSTKRNDSIEHPPPRKRCTYPART